MYFEEFYLGQKFYASGVEIKEKDITEFAATYDPLPIHLDESVAVSMAHDRIIAPGVMCFMLVWAAFVRQGIWQDTMIAGKFTKIEWYAPVFAGDVLHGEAVVSKLRPARGKGEMTVCFSIYNQEGTQVIHDTTELYVKLQP
jgi:acyl dehydratase